MMKTLLCLFVVSAVSCVAQLSMPVSPVRGNPLDLTIMVNPGLSSLFTTYLRIGSCRLQVHGDTIFVFEGASSTASSGSIGDGGIVQSGQCKVDLGNSKRFSTAYRLRIELNGGRPEESRTVIAEYSWVKAPYAFFVDTLGDWILPSPAAVKGQ